MCYKKDDELFTECAADDSRILQGLLCTESARKIARLQVNIANSSRFSPVAQVLANFGRRAVDSSLVVRNLWVVGRVVCWWNVGRMFVCGR